MDGMSLVLFRDNTDIQPPESIYEKKREGDTETEEIIGMFHQVPPPTFVNCSTDDFWVPKFDDNDDDAVEEVREKTWQEKLIEELKVKALHVLDHNFALLLVFVGTFWALFAEDMALGVPLDKEVDKPFAWTTLCFLIFFALEQLCRSVVQYEEYSFSFFWWMELVRARPRPAGQPAGDVAPMAHRSPPRAITTADIERRVRPPPL